MRSLRKMIYYQDEPSETIGIYAQFCVLNTARKKVKVLLNGQGSDESIAGYIPYYRHYLLDLLKERRIFTLTQEVIFGFRHIKEMLISFLRLILTQKNSKKMFTKNYLPTRNYWKESNKTLTERLLRDLSHSLPNVLRYEDRNSMAYGIESRLPFLDHRLVEFSLRLPNNLKIRRGWTKYILRQAMKKIMSPIITWRKGKYGYPVPSYDWFIKNKKAISKIFRSRRFGKRIYFNQDEVVSSFEDMCQDKRLSSSTYYLWRIFNLVLWLRIYFNSSGKKTYV